MASTILDYLKTVSAAQAAGIVTDPTVASSLPAAAASLYSSGTSTGLIPTNATGSSVFTTSISGYDTGSTSGSSSGTGSSSDQRLRLAHLSGYQVSGGSPYSGIQAPLSATSGLMFPYTPTIQFSQEVDYAHLSMTHSNTDYFSFTRSPNTTINVTGKFSVQNQQEGLYAMAAIQFLRTVSKMNFGQNDQNAGLPPPILTLSGYGTYILNAVRVFLKSHSYSFEENMDLVKVTVGSGSVWLPAFFTVSLSLVVQQTPRAMRQDFTLDKYRDGSLLAQGGWI